MSALVITLIRFGVLALLWLFVLLVVAALRRDVYGVKISERPSMRRQNTPVPVSSGRSPRASRSGNANAAPPAPQRQTLVVVAGPLSGTTLPLSNSAIVVGRSPDSALVLDDGYASARHARFYTQNGEWFVEDLNSTNGTWVGNERIYQPVLLQPGVPVTIGKTAMELRR